jgi:hypothetical protein
MITGSVGRAARNSRSISNPPFRGSITSSRTRSIDDSIAIGAALSPSPHSKTP